MPDDLSLPHRTDPLDSSGFHLQLRRLDSLQTLMTQGGQVVAEVAEFVARAREELATFQREQEEYAAAQHSLAEEKGRLLLRVSELEGLEREATARSRRLEGEVERLNRIVGEQERQSQDSQRSDFQRDNLEARLTEALQKIAALEHSQASERECQTERLERARREDGQLHETAMSALKARLAAVEQQLNVERVRRGRLMDVVKTHDVVVAPSLVRDRAGGNL